MEELEKAAADLKKKDAGWVTRRDGATKLGEIAETAIDTLNQFQEDNDVDVRLGVQRALEAVEAKIKPSAGFSGMPKIQSLKSMAYDLVKSGERDVSEHGDGFKVQVTLPRKNRKQTVYIDPYQRRDGVKLVRIYTFCGEPTDQAYRWALRTNTKLAQGYLSVLEGDDGKEHLALMNVYIESELTDKELKASVKEVSYYGDWIEEKFSQGDEL